MDEDIISKITKEIKKSGFPLEIYCLNICSKKNTGRMPNIRYMYEGKLREIDLFAFFEEIKLHPKKGENLQYTSTSIIVECKKSTKYPWFFSHLLNTVGKMYSISSNIIAILICISLKLKRQNCVINYTRN